MENQLQSKKLFSICLNESLLKKYGKVPSATFLANQFNLRAVGTTTITSETARKWLNGIAIPEMGRLQVLVNWLEINPMDFLGNGKGKNGSAEPKEDGHFFENLSKLLEELTPRDRKTIFITAWSLRELHSNQHVKMNYEKLILKRDLLKNIS